MRFKVILMTLILAVMLLPGSARAQEWVDELNLPTEGVYWEYLGLAAAAADTFWTVAPTLAAGSPGAATGYYAPKAVPVTYRNGGLLRETRRARFFVVIGKAPFVAQAFQNGQSAPTGGTAGTTGYTWCDSTFWKPGDLIVGAGTSSDRYPCKFAVEWADTLHLGGLASGQADSVKVFVGY